MANKSVLINGKSFIRRCIRKTWWLWLILVTALIFIAKAPLYRALFLSLDVIIAIVACSTLTDYFRLLRKENAITWCQILILVAIGIWIVGIILILGIRLDQENTMILGILGGLMAWIFQDKVKGVVTFIHLRFHHLLSIDDNIIVPKFNIDGEVKKVTLTTVIVYNWDTTTSSFPISALHSDHFINYEQMANGKTYGRLMAKSFIFDTEQFHELSAEEAEQLRNNDEIMRYLPEKEVHEGALNAQLFRLYLFHWLMNQPKISQMPRLMVRWMDQKESGMPLQVYVHIMEGSLAPFEWEQSQIAEHVMESLNWFNLRLYQSPSSHDVSDATLLLTKKEAESRKEVAL